MNAIAERNYADAGIDLDYAPAAEGKRGVPVFSLTPVDEAATQPELRCQDCGTVIVDDMWWRFESGVGPLCRGCPK